MTKVVKFIGDNANWIFEGIAGVILTLIVGVLVYRWQRRERLLIVPKKFSAAYDLKYYFGGFDADTMQDNTTEARLGVNPASLKIRCHNLTATPVILDEVTLLNTDTSEIVIRQDAMARRIDAHDSGEFDVSVCSTDAPCYEPPSWCGQVVVKTVRKKVFSSSPFKFGDLL